MADSRLDKKPISAYTVGRLEARVEELEQKLENLVTAMRNAAIIEVRASESYLNFVQSIPTRRERRTK